MSNAIETAASTDLITTGAITAVVAFAPGNATKLLEKIEREARAAAERLDISTAIGRADIASLAYKVAKTKTAFDGMGKSLVEGWKKQAGVIDMERRTIRDRLDALKDEVRAPLTAYEEAEKARVAGHEAALAAIPETVGYGATESAAELQVRLEHLQSLPARDWQEFAQRAANIIGAEITRTHDLLVVARQREADAAELVRLRAEQAERDRQDAEVQRQEREDRIRAEAAARAKQEAEAKAETERLAAERRAQAERDAIVRQRVEAEQAAQRAQEAAERAEHDRAAAVAKAEADAMAAAEKAERDRVAAVEAERSRAADAKAAEEAETARRTADRAHRAKVNNEAMTALAAAGLDDKSARAAVIAIARGAVAHVSIIY